MFPMHIKVLIIIDMAVLKNQNAKRIKENRLVKETNIWKKKCTIERICHLERRRRSFVLLKPLYGFNKTNSQLNYVNLLILHFDNTNEDFIFYL